MLQARTGELTSAALGLAGYHERRSCRVPCPIPGGLPRVAACTAPAPAPARQTRPGGICRIDQSGEDRLPHQNWAKSRRLGAGASAGSRSGPEVPDSPSVAGRLSPAQAEQDETPGGRSCARRWKTHPPVLKLTIWCRPLCQLFRQPAVDRQRQVESPAAGAPTRAQPGHSSPCAGVSWSSGLGLCEVLIVEWSWRQL